jgi:hypothetical protein
MSSPPTEQEIVDRARTVVLLSVVATAALYLIPAGWYLSYPLLLISTVFHELGHGFGAWFSGGSFYEFNMFSDASGYAITSSSSNFGRAMVLMGGLVGPAIGAMVCFIAARRARMARICLGAMGAWLLLAEILVVRSMFGLFFVGILGAVCLLIAWRTSAQVAQLALTFMAVQLALSVYSRGGYLFTESAGEGRPSDVAQLASTIGGPHWFWGVVCGLISVVCLIVGGWYLIRSSNRRTKMRHGVSAAGTNRPSGL